jgi:hypothetical protein
LVVKNVNGIQTIPYIAGARNHIYIIDILHSAFVLKNGYYLSIASRKRSLYYLFYVGI